VPSSIETAYDRLAERYAELFIDELDQKPFDRALLKDFAARVQPGQPIADIGCGPGEIGRFLHDLGLDVQGFDLSAGMVAFARRFHPTMRFTQADMRELPVEDGALGGLVAFYSIIHLPRTDAVVALREFHRVLVPGGPVLLAFHRGEGEIHSEKVLDTDISMDATLFGAAEMATFAEEAGLELDRLEVRPPYEFEWETYRVYLAAHRPPT
jgi:ubiquinone/menaquinone biosynthesis C-methylase UbiE